MESSEDFYMRNSEVEDLLLPELEEFCVTVNSEEDDLKGSMPDNVLLVLENRIGGGKTKYIIKLPYFSKLKKNSVKIGSADP